MREAKYYQANEDGRVACLLCPRYCRLQEGKRGSCGVRLAAGGKLIAESYGVCAALALDPVEKKPLYHFYPGRQIISLGTVGCNLHCRFCQNWSLARGEREQTRPLTPEQVRDIFQQSGCSRLGIAYTYNEPITWFEFILDTAPLIREAGGVNVMVTNGQIEAEPLSELLPYIDAFNIDVKAFTQDFYSRLTGGRLQTTLETVEKAAAVSHVELTYLVITGENDSVEEIAAFSRWVARLDQDIPLHFSRYFPNYRLQNPATPLEVMDTALETASAYLNHVYLGNVPGHRGSDTHCPRCGELLIKRRGYRVEIRSLQDNKCTRCGRPLRARGT